MLPQASVATKVLTTSMFWGQSSQTVSATTTTSHVEQSSSTVGHGRDASLSQAKVMSSGTATNTGGVVSVMVTK